MKNEEIEFDIPSEAPATSVATPVAVKANPCVTIFKYRKGWAVKDNCGDNFIYPTIGQAMNEARARLEEMESE